MEIIENMNVSDLTKKNYAYKFKNIVDGGINYRDTEENIINKLKTIKTTYNNISQYINIIILLRRGENLSVSKVLALREGRRSDNYGVETETNIKNKGKLPTKKELIDYCSTLFLASEYKKFIINYLIIVFNVRNKDLDLTVTFDTSHYLSENGNYVVLEKDKCTYIRNIYKTSNRYGKKINIITNENFLKSCKEYVKTNDKLLTTTNHNLEVINCTYNKIGQGRMLKVMLSELDRDKIINASKNRGTSIGTLINYYS